MALFYFAYGSNMSLAQMQERCPESERVGIGHLPGHRLVFPRFSMNRQCGVAGVEAHPEHEVWGVIYRLSPADGVRLDRFEGYEAGRRPDLNNYNRVDVTIHGHQPEPRGIGCMTYVPTRQGDHFPPDHDYHGLLLSGARENLLPQHYVDLIERIAVLPRRQAPIM
ncbi:MAG: gamma-glutamylcyclotransferase [Alphaproteobacteria bacterium]|nr:gamma-glutamylcyclotransferase [Alphaproteobacteria bacterium]